MWLFPGPPVLAIVPSSPPGARAPRAGLARFPASAASGLLRVEPPLEPLAVAEGTHQLWGREPQMHEIAEATSVAFTILVLTAACFTKIGYGRQLRVERATCDAIGLRTMP